MNHNLESESFFVHALRGGVDHDVYTPARKALRHRIDLLHASIAGRARIRLVTPAFTHADLRCGLLGGEGVCRHLSFSYAESLSQRRPPCRAAPEPAPHLDHMRYTSFCALCLAVRACHGWRMCPGATRSRGRSCGSPAPGGSSAVSVASLSRLSRFLSSVLQLEHWSEPSGISASLTGRG